MRWRRGFTLIELLVVIAIIAILAAILFPVFSSAKRKAQMASCQSNMKQVASAMIMYANDNNGVLPMSHWGTAWTNNDSFWGFAIRKYCSDKKDVCYCPSTPPVFMTSSWSGPQYPYYWGTSIGMNLALGHDGTTNSGSRTIPAARVDEVGSTARTIMLGDTSLYAYQSGWNEYTAQTGIKSDRLGHWAMCPGSRSRLGKKIYLNPWPSGWPEDFFDPKRHNGKINIAFLDAHVSAFDRDFLLAEHSTNAKDPNYTWWDKY